MNDINTFYYNDFGIAFQWKRCAAKNFKKIQLVFRNSGLLLTFDELVKFSVNIENSLKLSRKIEGCAFDKCQCVLVQAPNPQTSFAMNYNELSNLNNLVKGTIFNLNFHNIIDGILNT